MVTKENLERQRLITKKILGNRYILNPKYTGCKHVWKIKEEHIITEKSLLIFSKRSYVSQIIVLQCLKCGEIKNHFVPRGDIN